MPTYTFRCRKCQQKFQVVHSFHEPHPTVCNRLITVPAFPEDPGDGHNFTVLENIEDLSKIPPFFKTKTEVCGGELLRVFDMPAGIHYHVSGFYTMDSKYTPVKPIDYNADEDEWPPLSP